MVHPEALLGPLERCAARISEDSPLGARVQDLRDTPGELIPELMGRRSACRRPPSPCLN